jgi:S-adenosylmethionine synthetase
MKIHRNIYVEKVNSLPIDEQPVELVERKGIGHPDSICDAIMEATSITLCREYQERFGRILHHNFDKGLLVAGRTVPQFGGGKVVEPMRLIFGDRGTYEYLGVNIPIGEIAEFTAQNWLRENLRFVDPLKHIVFQNEIKPGSGELTDIFSRKVIGANDTSAGVGYAPLSETERLVLAAEKFLNAPSFKDSFPEAGEDIKVMGYRLGKNLTLTVAMAFVDRFIQNARMYFDRKYAVQKELQAFITKESGTMDLVTVAINTLDDPERGDGGMYLTVLGTSAEAGDGGQVGRGNRVNGVIAFNRPSTTEAAAGKNPVSHVGKIYNLLSHEIAFRIYREVGGIRQVTVWLCSQIGQPIDQPLIAEAQLILEPKVHPEDVRGSVVEVIDRELEGIQSFTRRLAQGELSVC